MPPDRNPVRRSRAQRAQSLGCVVALVLALGACAAEPVAPPAPDPVGFDVSEARAVLAEAQRSEQAGGLARSFDHYRRAADLWPTLPEAWQGLARVAARRGDGKTARLALFFADRVADYDTLHPRQARLAFAAALQDPPQDLPRAEPWAARLVAFFEYKDAEMQAAAFAARPRRSWIERNALAPVAVGSVGAFGYAVGSAAGAFGE